MKKNNAQNTGFSLMVKKAIGLFLFPIIILFPALLYGQAGLGSSNTMPSLGNYIPVSPNAASLGKFGEIPVSAYTGIPSIDIPIYQINTGKLTLPVSLDYHAGGVKVEDLASSIGIGWSLNAGGVITRETRGIPDEGSGGYLQTYSQITQYLSGQMAQTPAVQQQYLDNIQNGIVDCQQDIFNYSLGSTSGRFVFDSTGQVISMVDSRNKIEFGTFQGVSGCWKITDENGIQYFFLNKETTLTRPVTNNTLSQNPPPAVVSSWYLSKIYNATLTDSIILTYNTFIGRFTTNNTQTKYINVSPGNGPCNNHTDISYANNLINSVRLQSISFNGGSISFTTAAQARCDYPSDYAIASINVQNNSQNFNKTYNLYQSYQFVGGSSCNSSSPDSSRLYLDSVSITSANAATEWYRLTYFSRNLPSRRSYNQDFWGYYNGASNETDFIPTTNLFNTGSLANGTVIQGANRDANFQYAIYGTLNSIQYPTGGKTVFDFEANKVNNLITLFAPPAISKGVFLFYIPSSPGLGLKGKIIDSIFVIDSSVGGGVNVNYTVNNGSPGCSNNQMVGCPVTTITSANGTVLTSITHNGTIFLSPGTYHAKGDLRFVEDSSILNSYACSIRWTLPTTAIDTLRNNGPVAGIRVLRITNYDYTGSATSIRKFDYRVPDSATYSSGRILSYPTYIGKIDVYTAQGFPAGSITYDCVFATISSRPANSMLSDQSSYVTYQYVTELNGENGEFGKHTTQFTSSDKYPDIVSNNFPFPPPLSRYWKRGKPLHEWTYRFNASTADYTLINERINTYNDIISGDYLGIQIGQQHFNNSPDFLDNNEYIVAQCNTEVGGWFSLSSSVTNTYDQNTPSNYLSVVENYGYNASHQLARTQTLNSRGENVTTIQTYPSDYSITGTATDPSALAIQNLQSRNIWNPIVEKYTQIANADGSNNRTAGSIFTTYKPDVLLPATIYRVDNAVSLGNFTPATITSSGITMDNRYKPYISINQYDTHTNVVEQQKVNDTKEVYLWGYNFQYPVAKIVGSDFNTVSTKVDLSALNNGTDAQIQQQFSNLRSAFAASPLVQIWTYTYAPLVGITSDTDPKGYTTYYEYDSLGRLIDAKDKDGNVIKKYNYHYQNQ